MSPSKTSTRTATTVALLFAGLVVGAIGGAGGMLIAYPYLFPPAAASDAPPVATTGKPASFRFDPLAPGRDPVHWADGSGSIVQTEQGWVLRLADDFKAGPGPNYWLYLNTRAIGEESDFNADAGRIRLTKLRSFEGAQNYLLPPGVEPARFHTLTIWCETFGAYIGSAALQPAKLASLVVDK